VANPGLHNVAGDAVVLDGASGGTVSLDGASPSVAAVTFGGSAGMQISPGSGGTLQLDNGSALASVSVLGGLAAISAPLTLDSNTVISTAAGSTLTIHLPRLCSRTLPYPSRSWRDSP
jgi:hypothetical protein